MQSGEGKYKSFHFRLPNQVRKVDAFCLSVCLSLFQAAGRVSWVGGTSDLLSSRPSRDLDVLCLTETWLREAGDDVTIGEMTPPGFSFLHRQRVSG